MMMMMMTITTSRSIPPFPTPRTNEIDARGPETLRYTHPPRTPWLLAVQHPGRCDTWIRERGERCGHGDSIGLGIVAQVPGCEADRDGGTILICVVRRRHLASNFCLCSRRGGGMTVFGVLGRVCDRDGGGCGGGDG